MTCKGVMCTERHLGIDTAQIKCLCKAIIKMCDENPHSIDSLLEQAYVELSSVQMLMKNSFDRAQEEEARFKMREGKIKQERTKIPDLAHIYSTNLTTPRIAKMLEQMSPDELEAIMCRVKAKRDS